MIDLVKVTLLHLIMISTLGFGFRHDRGRRVWPAVGLWRASGHSQDPVREGGVHSDGPGKLSDVQKIYSRNISRGSSAALKCHSGGNKARESPALL